MVKKCVCDIDTSNVNQHIARINTHRVVLSINSMYSRSYSQTQNMMEFHRLGHNREGRWVGGRWDYLHRVNRWVIRRTRLSSWWDTNIQSQKTNKHTLGYFS